MEFVSCQTSKFKKVSTTDLFELNQKKFAKLDVIVFTS